MGQPLSTTLDGLAAREMLLPLSLLPWWSSASRALPWPQPEQPSPLLIASLVSLSQIDMPSRLPVWWVSGSSHPLILLLDVSHGEPETENVSTMPI